jgi:hypothetical protein
MVSIDEIGDKLDAVNSKLQSIHDDLDKDLKNVIALLSYADKALYHINLQNDTIICILEKISHHTCEMLNESHLQTGRQQSMDKNIEMLTKMYIHSHPQSAIMLDETEKLRKEIEKCCPPPKEPPICSYESCKAEKQIGPPPEQREPTHPPH